MCTVVNPIFNDVPTYASASEPRERSLALHVRVPIIGLTGLMGAGKDTVGALLGMVGYTMTAFADGLRGEVLAALNAGNAVPSMDPKIRAAWERLSADRAAVWRKPTKDYARVILQWYGTEHRRAKNPDYWVRVLRNYMKPGRPYVITDLRFANEADMVHELGGQVWLIERPNTQSTGIAGHASERLDGIFPDRVVRNDDSLRNLVAAVKVALSPAPATHCA